MLPGTVDIGLLESLARTLIEQVSRPYSIEGNRVTIGASVGIAIGDPGRSNADSLVRDADLALYAAKDDGPVNASTAYPPHTHQGRAKAASTATASTGVGAAHGPKRRSKAMSSSRRAWMAGSIAE